MGWFLRSGQRARGLDGPVSRHRGEAARRGRTQNVLQRLHDSVLGHVHKGLLVSGDAHLNEADALLLHELEAGRRILLEDERPAPRPGEARLRPSETTHAQYGLQPQPAQKGEVFLLRKPACATRQVRPSPPPPRSTRALLYRPRSTIAKFEGGTKASPSSSDSSRRAMRARVAGPSCGSPTSHRRGGGGRTGPPSYRPGRGPTPVEKSARCTVTLLHSGTSPTCAAARTS